MGTEGKLINKQCRPCKGGTQPLAPTDADNLMKQLAGWERLGHLIVKTCHFKNHYETIAFVNALAWISHREDHHPELTVGYQTCRVEYTTHTVHGLSENDFICAAKVDTLFKT